MTEREKKTTLRIKKVLSPKYHERCLDRHLKKAEGLKGRNIVIIPIYISPNLNNVNYNDWSSQKFRKKLRIPWCVDQS